MIRFTIPAPIMGYRQTTKKAMFHPKERARSKAYGQWKEKVRILAYTAGFRSDGLARPDRPPVLSTHVLWKGRPLVDWKNVHGAVEDALFHVDDRYVKPGRHSDVEWNCGIEEIRVVLE